MSDNTGHVLLISDDRHLRRQIARQRPTAAKLHCLTAAEALRGPMPSADEYWLDLDAAELDLPQCSRRVYFQSGTQTGFKQLPSGQFVRKPCTDTLLDVLWAGVERRDPPALDTPQADMLPIWLLGFQELRLKELCHKCVTRLPTHLGYAEASMYLHNPEQSILTLAETNRRRPIALAVHTDNSRTQLMTVVSHAGKLFVTDNVAEEYAARGMSRPRHCEHYSDDSCLIAPLLSDGQLRGVLNFNQKLRVGSAPSRELLVPIFTFLGRALHHASAYDRARTEARVDGLTGLFNYRWVTEAARREIGRADRFRCPLSLIMVDLDGLKIINDKHGHAAGDFLLRHVATRITVALRQFDMAARVGGDEFVALLPSTDLAGAQHVARRILRTIREDAALFRDVPLPITASIGVVQWREGWPVDRFLEAADQAMYRAKGQGRNRVVCRTRGEEVLPPSNAATQVIS